MPDVAYVSKARQAAPLFVGWNPIAPDLAVEVVSDEGDATELRTLMLKIGHYQAAGTVVWVVLPVSRCIDVYAPGVPPRRTEAHETLDGAPVLPGFTLALAELFATTDAPQG
jgi:Uma2 family endonuclease